MYKSMRDFIVWNTVLLISISACTQPAGQAPTSTPQPQNTVTPRVKSTLPATWTPTIPPTLIATFMPPPPPTATLTRTPFPARAPRDTATPTAIGAPTATSVAMTDTITNPVPLDGTPSLSGTLTLSPTLTATPRPKKILIGAFDPIRALVLIYGPHATSNIHVKLSQPFTQTGVAKYLLLAEIPGQNCRACAASIGGAIFERVGNNWEITVEDRHIITMGAFGHAPEGEFIKLGPDTYGVRFDDSYVSTESLGTRLVLITADEEHLRVALDMTSAAGQFAEDESIAWSYESEVDFIAGDNAAYHDIKITAHGTKPFEGEIVAFEEIAYYTFGRWNYYLSGSE